MLCLSEEDIHEAMMLNDAMDAIEAIFRLYESGDFCMPRRIRAEYHGNTMLVMPCFTRASWGAKLVGIFPRNDQKELPTLHGVMVLCDGQTGQPLALLNGTVLTALRTGAVGGVSIRYLSPNNATAVGIVGAGLQGFYQALFACQARPITDVYVFDLAPYKMSYFMETLTPELPGVALHQTHSIDELVEKSQIVITATNSKIPVLPNHAVLLAKKHFVGIGSYRPDMREFPKALFQQLHHIFIDTDHALEETGDLIEPLKQQWIRPDQVRTFGRFLMENKAAEVVKHETTLFKSVGMALFDLGLAGRIYENALRLKLGQDVSL